MICRDGAVPVSRLWNHGGATVAVLCLVLPCARRPIGASLRGRYGRNCPLGALAKFLFQALGVFVAGSAWGNGGGGWLGGALAAEETPEDCAAAQDEDGRDEPDEEVEAAG